MDSILVNFLGPWLERVNTAYGDELTINHIKWWEWHSLSKGGMEVYSFLKEPGFFRHLKPLPGAIAALKELVDRGHEVFVVTAAEHAPNFSDKVEWVREHLPFIDKRHLVMAHEKHIIPGDVLIDDGPHNAEAYAKAHPKAKIIGIKYPYNIICPHYTLLAGSWEDTEGAWAEILKEIK